VLKYAIVVEHEHSLPAYVRADPNGHCHLSSSLTKPPPEHFQYSSSELPVAMKVLKRDYPSFIVAHEVNYIDHLKMSDWWSRKRVQQLAAETTQGNRQRRR
jgi:hypothetical protein